MKEVVHDVPKSMAPINGRPLLEYLMDDLLAYQVDHLIISVGYKKEAIMEYFGPSYRGIKIDYAIEHSPLGTGGGIALAFKQVEGEQALVLNGDTLFRINFDEFLRFHNDHHSDFSLALKSVEDTSRYGAVLIDGQARILEFYEKNKQAGKGLINGGVYLIEKVFFKENSFQDSFSLEKDCLESMVKSHVFYGMENTNYFLDIGIPHDYQKAHDEFKGFKD